MDKPCFNPPKGGWFRGRYISKEEIQDMLDWCQPTEELTELLKKELDDVGGIPEAKSLPVEDRTLVWYRKRDEGVVGWDDLEIDFR